MKRKVKRAVLLCSGILFLISFMFFSALTVGTYLQYKNGLQTYENLKSSVIGVSNSTAVTIPKAPISVDFASLKKTNPDIVGWMYCEGTVINYPVVQGKDNVFYLSHMADKKSNGAGALFVDYRNAAGFMNQNTLIYGHHMKNGSMFASLVQYKTQAYYDAHPVMYLLTPERDYKVALFSGFICDTSSNVYDRQFSPETEYMELLADAVAKSNFKSTVQVLPADKIITMSTCTYEFADARYVVLGKLIPLP